MPKRFQFRLSTLMLLMAIVPIWLASGAIISTNYAFGTANGVLACLGAFAGTSAALYRLVGRCRYGWAIAAIAAPLLAVGILSLVARVNNALI